MQVEEKSTVAILREWLGRGIFTPGKLKKLAQNLRVRPAYYPIWTFDASYNAKWGAKVEVRENKWEWREGESILFFDDILVPGSQQLTVEDLRRVAPFDFKQQVAFHEAFLAGWPAILYDQSLADASIAARGEMARQAREMLEDRVLVGQNKKEFRVTPKGLSDQSYRQILVPLWVGHYTYDGKAYRVLINGQTGKAGGEKPKDPFKLGLAVALILLLLGLGIAGAWLLLAALG